MPLATENTLEDLIDTLVGEIEESLVKLERSLGLIPNTNYGKKAKKKYPHPSVKELRKKYAKSQNKKTEQIATIPNTTPQEAKMDSYTETTVKAGANSENLVILDKMATKEDKTLNPEFIPKVPKPNKVVKKSNTPVAASRNFVSKTKTIEHKAVQKLQVKEKRYYEKENDKQREVAHEQNTEFVDILPQYKIVHIYGKPGTGKTTFAIQCALEMVPNSTYYFVSGHTAPLIQRINQMLNTQRWQNTPLKSCFFLVTYESLEDLKQKLDKLELQLGDKQALIVIDYLVSQVRGLLYKEEIRSELSSILEKLMLLAEKKRVKVLLLNGSSYAGKPIVEDLFESYADLTLELKKNGEEYTLSTETEVIGTFIDSSGFNNLIINIFF